MNRRDDIAMILSITARMISILVMAFFSIGLYFRIQLWEPNPIIMWAEMIIPWIAIAILWLEALGILQGARP